MLSSKNRLREKSDINKVFRDGKAVAGCFVFLKVLKNGLDDNRFAFVVSSKISKKAVIRNKIKRRLREIIKQTQLKQGFDFVVVTKPSIVDKGFQEIKQDLNEIFNSKINKIVSG